MKEIYKTPRPAKSQSFPFPSGGLAEEGFLQKKN